MAVAHLLPLAAPAHDARMANDDPTDVPEPGALTDRRAHPRLTLRAEVTMHSQDNLMTGLTEDVSLGGVYIANMAPPPVGELIRLELSVEGHERLVLDAEVRWHREDELGEVQGCGLRFIELTAFQQSRLAEIVKDLPQEPLFDVEAFD